MRINEITRPDNLAMVRYSRAYSGKAVAAGKKPGFTITFAMVDSQPAHNPAFGNLVYDLVIDHHPRTDLTGRLGLNPDAFVDIRLDVGATSYSMMMTCLPAALRLRPSSGPPACHSPLLGGIRTDTGTFRTQRQRRDFLRAYQWLRIMRTTIFCGRISRSEYLRSWLPFFLTRWAAASRIVGLAGHTPRSTRLKSADSLVSSRISSPRSMVSNGLP